MIYFFDSGVETNKALDSLVVQMHGSTSDSSKGVSSWALS